MTAQATSAQGLFDRASFWLSVLEVFANVNKIQREKLWDKKSNRSYPDKYRWTGLNTWGVRHGGGEEDCVISYTH